MPHDEFSETVVEIMKHIVLVCANQGWQRTLASKRSPSLRQAWSPASLDPCCACDCGKEAWQQLNTSLREYLRWILSRDLISIISQRRHHMLRLVFPVFESQAHHKCWGLWSISTNVEPFKDGLASSPTKSNMVRTTFFASWTIRLEENSLASAFTRKTYRAPVLW